MTIDQNLARLRTHSNNIRRYRSLLKSKLTELERQFIEKRLREEQIEIKKLSTAATSLCTEALRNSRKTPLDPMSSRGESTVGHRYCEDENSYGFDGLTAPNNMLGFQKIIVRS